MTVAGLRHRLAELANVPEPAVRAACKEVERIAREEGGTITANRGRVYKLRAITRIKASGDTVTATVYGVPTGFWVWKNTGTDPHPIAAKGRGKKRRALSPAAGGGHPVRQVRHPGTSGHGAWRRVIKRSRPVVRDAIADHVHKVVTGG